MPFRHIAGWGEKKTWYKTSHLTEKRYISILHNVSDLYVTDTVMLGGRVLDSRPRGRGLEPHRRHCIVSLSKTH